MIKLTSLTKKFGRTVALNEVSLTIEKGEVVGLLGPNGAGKTTMMRTLVGYLTPSSGKITVFDRDPLEDRVFILSSVGYLPENNPLYGEMLTGEYLDFITHMKGDTAANEKKIIEKTGLKEKLHSAIDDLSRGYKQRVGLAAALLGDPTLIILDEPTSGLDPIEQDKIRELINTLGKEKTVILSTHILSEVEEVATRLLIIDKGALVYDGKKPKGKGAVRSLFTEKISQ